MNPATTPNHPNDAPAGRTALEFAEGLDGLRLGGSADHDFGDEDGEPHQGDAEQVDENEQSAPIFTGDVGELPDVAQPDGGAGRGQDEACSARPLTSLFGHGSGVLPRTGGGLDRCR